MKTLKYIPILLLFVCVAAIAPLLNAQPLQLCRDNGTYADDVVITACLDRASYNLGDTVQITGFLRANRLVTDVLPPTVNMAWYFDKPDLHNSAIGDFTASETSYDFAFTLQPDLVGDWQLTILTQGLGHNALQFIVHVENPLTTITTQTVVVSTSQVTAKSTATILSNTLVNHTKTVITVVPEFPSFAVVFISALFASLFLLRRAKHDTTTHRAHNIVPT